MSLEKLAFMAGAFVLFISFVSTAAHAENRDLKESIIAKLEYDRHYFANVVRLHRQGQRDRRFPGKSWNREVSRAKLNLPILQRFEKEKPSYLQGESLTLPPEKAAHRVYVNLLSVLNMQQAAARDDHTAVLSFGKRVVLEARESLGLVREGAAEYYLELYREYFFLMASANYRLGNDKQAIEWLARLEANADVLALQEQLAKEKGGSRNDAMDVHALRMRAVAIFPFEGLGIADDQQWLSLAFAEVLTADLAQYSDLIVVERSQLAKILEEVSLGQLGITTERAGTLGAQLDAGTSLLGSFRPTKDGLELSLRLVATENSQVIAATSGMLSMSDPFKDARLVLLALFEKIGWLDAAVAEDLTAAHAPKPEVLRQLVEARLLLGKEGGQARELYTQAMRQDPTYASMFEELRNEFSDVSATLAIMPFVNASGREEDLWMVGGLSQALSSDLPKLGFSVVERERLADMLDHAALGQVLGEGKARQLGERLDADFLVMGGIMRQAPQLRVDVRFVEVRTGVVVFATSVENREDDFMQVLVALAAQIGERFHERLTDDQLKEFTGRKLSRDDFEKLVRADLARQAIKPRASASHAPSRTPFWLAVAGVIAGSAAGVTGLVMSDHYSDRAVFSHALAQVSGSEDDRARHAQARDDAAQRASVMQWTGYGALGVAALSLGYLIYKGVSQPEGAGHVDVLAGPASQAGGLQLGLSGKF